MREVYMYDGSALMVKLTCEELSDGTFIATHWMPEDGSEVDREVKSFETYSAALAHMYKNGLELSLQFSNLRMFGKMKRDPSELCSKCGGAAPARNSVSEP